MPDLFEKGAREGEMEIEAMKKLYEAMFKSLLDIAKGAQPGLQIEKKLPLEIEKKKRGVAKAPQPQEQEAAVDDALTVGKTEKQKKEQQQAVDDDFIIDKTKKLEKEPYGRVFGPGVNKLTESDCKTLAAIMSGKKGAIIDSDYDYVIKYNGKVLFETTMGEITTHKKLPPELYNKIAALSPDPKTFDKLRDKLTDAADWLKPEVADWGQSGKDVPFKQSSVGLPIVDLIDTPLADLIDTPKSNGRHPLADKRAAEISNAINSPEPSNIQIPPIVPETRHPLADKRVAKISNAINSPPAIPAQDTQLLADKLAPLPETKTEEVIADLPSTKDIKESQEVILEPEAIELEQGIEPETAKQQSTIDPSPNSSKSPYIDKLISQTKARAIADIAVIKNSASQAKGVIDYYMRMGRGIPAGTVPESDHIDKSFEAVKGMFEEIARDEENELKQGLRSPVVIDPLDPEIARVDAFFKVFNLNSGVDQTTEKGREGTITFPTGEQLVNEIQGEEMFLSLVKDGKSQQLGSYDHRTKDFTVGADIAAAEASLNQISQQLDEKWLIRQPSISLDAPAVNNRTNPVEKPVLKQEVATADPNSFYNFEAQENLIGKILLEPAAMQQSIGVGISEKSFSPGLHRDIFVAARAITDEGHQVNGETIAKAMDAKQPSIRTDLATILARNTPGTSVDSIAEVVREKQIRRDIDRMAADLGKSAHDKTQPVFQTLRSSQNHATSIADGSYAISQQPPSLTNGFAADNLKNVGSERLIIAAILNTPHPIKDLAATGLTSKVFTDPDHQEIFRAAETLHEKGLENNLMTIRNQVSDRAAVKASEIASNVTPQMVREPISNVMGLAQRRDLVDVSDKLAAAAAQPRASKAELLEALGKAKEDIKSVSSKSPKLPELEITTTTVNKSNDISRGR